ncbi:MAG TPA: hypothetical protein VGH34_20290 [Vicinamibacterales bacterium]|jgi:hypothetical protein
MNRARIVAVGLAVAFAITFAVGDGVAHLKAFNPQPDPPRFGMVGIAEGQTARLNLVNLLSPDPSTLPPGPCRAELQFLDGDGNVVASRGVQLTAGHAAFLDFTPSFVPVSTNGDAVAPLRAEIRANVALGVAGLPPGPCRATLEIFDNATARTTVFVPSGPRACPGNSPGLPPDPCVVGSQDPNGQ